MLVSPPHRDLEGPADSCDWRIQVTFQDLVGRHGRTMLTVEEAADELTISRSTAYRLIDEGSLPSRMTAERRMAVPAILLAEWVVSGDDDETATPRSPRSSAKSGRRSQGRVADWQSRVMAASA